MSTVLTPEQVTQLLADAAVGRSVRQVVEREVADCVSSVTIYAWSDVGEHVDDAVVDVDLMISISDVAEELIRQVATDAYTAALEARRETHAVCSACAGAGEPGDSDEVDCSECEGTGEVSQ